MTKRVVLVNHFHAGDIIMCRPLIKRVRPLLIDKVALSLKCNPRYWYLWADLGLPQYDEHPAAKVIDLWFAHGGDLLGVTGMTYATHVTSYNRQAEALGLPLLTPGERSPSLDLPTRHIPNPPGVFVENGPVCSSQRVHDLNGLLKTLANTFPKIPFYCTGKIPSRLPHTVVDCSKDDLITLQALSHKCKAMLSRLSGPFIATLTEHNRGRLKRLVHGEPIGCPIWDESDVEYFQRPDAMVRRLAELL